MNAIIIMPLLDSRKFLYAVIQDFIVCIFKTVAFVSFSADMCVLCVGIRIKLATVFSYASYSCSLTEIISTSAQI